MNESFPAFEALCFRGDGGDPEVNSERKTELYVTRNGSTEEIILPELTEKMALKDTQMNVNDMLAVWRGETSHLYGEQAIHATLVSYLILLEGYDVDEANTLATQMWAKRDKTALPFTQY